jgi:hemolysin III
VDGPLELPTDTAGDARPRRWHELKDPFPAWSHWAGAALGVAALVALLRAAHGPLQTVAFAVYGASLIALYSASAVAHSLHREGPAAERFDRLDYAAIFVLIAGTYTPFCLVTLQGVWRWGLLSAAWSVAALGIVTVFWTRGTRHWPRVVLYVLMGWMCVVAAGQLSRALPAPAIGWLVAGGVVYTVGALVYLAKRPRLWPGRFGSHDLWHCMVLVGSACHFIAVIGYVR